MNKGSSGGGGKKAVNQVKKGYVAGKAAFSGKVGSKKPQYGTGPAYNAGVNMGMATAKAKYKAKKKGK